jgi:sortase A
MRKLFSLKFFVVFSFVGGISMLSSGFYIRAKACVAQLLLENAWQKTIRDGVPLKPWPWADTWPVARLKWPEQGIDLVVLEGVFGSALAFGPGRMEGSAMPGVSGNSIICGHRDTVFSFLEHVRFGERFFIQTQDGRQLPFVVSDIVIENQNNIRLRVESDEPRLTLITCYPFDGLVPGELRYLVFAEPPKG